jgi:hypothetical protein
VLERSLKIARICYIQEAAIHETVYLRSDARYLFDVTSNCTSDGLIDTVVNTQLFEETSGPLYLEVARSVQSFKSHGRVSVGQRLRVIDYGPDIR